MNRPISLSGYAAATSTTTSIFILVMHMQALYSGGGDLLSFRVTYACYPRKILGDIV
jgi:hypothetical protein